MKVAVVGLGYVGLPLAVKAAQVGHYVVGIDPDPRKISSINSGTSYIEDVTDEEVAEVRGGNRLLVHKEMLASHGDFDIALITVPTPVDDEGVPDLSYVEQAAEAIGRVMRPGCAVVLESTTYPGTTEGLLAETLTRYSKLTPGVDFHLGFSPERIDPGPSPYTLENTPKLVSATTSEGLEVIQGFYDTIVETTVPVSSPRVAEMAKIYENTQAYVNIALINELADFCHQMDIDVHEMNAAAMTKGHSMALWHPGTGVGGHCLPVDPLYLSWQSKQALGMPLTMIELAASINNSRPAYVAQRAQHLLAMRDLDPRETNVLVLGVAYKADVGDLRESPAVDVVINLLKVGIRVTVLDPHVERWTLTPRIDVEDLTSSIADYDLVVVATEHSAVDYAKVAVEAQQVLDCRNVVPSAPTVVPL